MSFNNIFYADSDSDRTHCRLCHVSGGHFPSCPKYDVCRLCYVSGGHSPECPKYDVSQAFDENGVCKHCNNSIYGCPYCHPETEFVGATEFQNELAGIKGGPIGVGEPSEEVFPSFWRGMNVKDQRDHLIQSHGMDEDKLHNLDLSEYGDVHDKLHDEENFGENYDHFHGYDTYPDQGALVSDIIGHQPHPNTHQNYAEMSKEDQKSHMINHHSDVWVGDNSVDEHMKFHSLLDDSYEAYYQDAFGDREQINHEHWLPSSRQDDAVSDTQGLLDEIKRNKPNRVQRRSYLIEKVLDSIYGEL